MSSPFIPQYGDYPDRNIASSPVNSTMTALDLQEPSIRPMRLKVLYSFDLENKTNCLARWPEILNIRTAHLDEQTQIGVVELKTCIKAIVDASPEILSRINQDYTVYAYDYSEYDTPQVGQGMLSRVLASVSPTPSAPAAQSDTVVTGRVCKSMLGLFANGIQETLEVKLRLVPVPNSLQNEYVESMKQQREYGPGIPEGVDPRAWAEFIKQNPSMMSVINPSGRLTPNSGTFPSSHHGIEHVQRLMSEGYRPQSAQSHSIPPQPHTSYAGSIASGHASNRSNSPTPSLVSLATIQPNSRHPRPMSRTSNEGSHIGNRRMSIGTANEPGYDEERTEDGPARKRARLTKADHPGKSTLTKTFDTLRATASTAASIRVLQPTAVRPGVDAIRSLEAPPRAPTPTPTPVATGPNKRPQIQSARSGLGRELSLTSDSGYKSLDSEGAITFPDSCAASPDNMALASEYNSPEEPASSPPVCRPPSVVPTSPMLPIMPHGNETFDDTGLDDLFGESAEVMTRDGPPLPTFGDSEQSIVPELPPRVPAYQPVAPPFLRPPTQAEIEAEAKAAEEAKRREISHRNARRAVGLLRSQTWSGDSGQSSSTQLVQPGANPSRPASSAAPTNATSEQPQNREKSKKKNTAWNKTARRQAIESKLKQSIDAGEMPPYCENCGTVETPTWRKAYSKIYSSDHSHLQVSDEQNGILCIDVLETNPDGSNKTVKVFKKSLAPDDDGFAYVLLCNPCGIFLSNRKCMRPEKHWLKKPQRRTKRSRQTKTQDDEADTSSAPNMDSEVPTLTSEAPMPALEFGEDSVTADFGDKEKSSKFQSIPSLQKSVSMPEPMTDLPSEIDSYLNPTDFAALQRAIQSSPSRFLGPRKNLTDGSKQSPDPARRSLFPSPKSGGPLGVDIEKNKPPSAKKALPPKTPNEIRLSITAEEVLDKENQPPQPIEIGDLDELFSDLPTTPSRKRGNQFISPSALFKTPAIRNSPSKGHLTTGDFFSSAAKAFLHAPQTPNRTPRSKALDELTPFTRHLNQLLSEPNMESPSRFLNDIGPFSSAIDDSHVYLANGSTPGKIFRSGDFDFSDFPSSDGPMPSSPPAWFGIYKDHGKEESEAVDESWDFGTGPQKDVASDDNTGARQGSKELRESDQVEAKPAMTTAIVPAVAAV